MTPRRAETRRNSFEYTRILLARLSPLLPSFQTICYYTVSFWPVCVFGEKAFFPFPLCSSHFAAAARGICCQKETLCGSFTVVAREKRGDFRRCLLLRRKQGRAKPKKSWIISFALTLGDINLFFAKQPRRHNLCD